MRTRLLPIILVALLALQIAPTLAREGNTLVPIEIEAAPLETYPEDLLAESDFEAIEARVTEARVSGVPLAVRIVDMTQETSDLPFPIRQFARDDFSEPYSQERQDAIAESWSNNETIETSANANDGFLLLVLVPEDRTQTQAIWWLGDNALPINGLTEQNIQATQDVMNEQFADGNMPNGVYLGVSEFSYNIQFGMPEQLERSDLDEALHTAMYAFAAATALAGLATPILAWWLAHRNNSSTKIEQSISPWHAATLQMKRAHPNITTAILLDAVHSREIQPRSDGSVRIDTPAGNIAVETLRPFANSDDMVPEAAMLEVEAITAPIREQFENDLAEIEAVTPRVLVDRTWMLLAMGVALLLAIATAIPTVASMSAWGVYAIGIAIIGVLIGWWWLANRDYTSPAGKALLADWLESASAEDRHRFDMAVNLDLFTDQAGGPNVNKQTRLVRQLRGLSAG